MFWLWLLVGIFAVFTLGTYSWAMMKASAQEAPEWSDATTLYEWKANK